MLGKLFGVGGGFDFWRWLEKSTLVFIPCFRLKPFILIKNSILIFQLLQRRDRPNLLTLSPIICCARRAVSPTLILLVTTELVYWDYCWEEFSVNFALYVDLETMQVLSWYNLNIFFLKYNYFIFYLKTLHVYIFVVFWLYETFWK